MSTSKPDLFKKSLIAAAVFSLSACSTVPQQARDYDLSRVGEGILKAGRTTADVSGRVWNRTTYLLGFSDDDGRTVSDEGLLMDAEDVALLEESKSSSDAVVRPIVIRRAVPSNQDKTPINAASAAQLQTHTNAPATETQELASNVSNTASQPVPSQTAAAQGTTMDAAASVAQNLSYEVAPNETLWDIAKSTTGDATNWHLLADSNNLGPGAAVYPGQKLIIPANLLKSERTQGVENPIESQASSGSYVDTQNLASNTSATGSVTVQQNADAPITDSPAVFGQPFEVGPGETLWDFAKRITGDATNWQVIANENRFTAQQATLVRTGQTIYVPEELIKPDLGAASPADAPVEEARLPEVDVEPVPTAQVTVSNSGDAQNAPLPNEKQTAKQGSDNDDLAITVITSAAAASRQAKDQLMAASSTSTTDILSEGGTLLDETQPIKIIEATYKVKEQPVVAPSEPASVAKSIEHDGANAESPASIMVSGTYYPKAVYNEADFSSSLLMRVSPGTTLQVSKSIGNWFQVKTSKGIGYVHQRDIR